MHGTRFPVLGLLVVASFALSSFNPGSAQRASAQGTWTTDASLTTPRQAFAAAVAGNEIHVFGGLDNGPTTVLASHERFDGSAWGIDPAMPTARNQLATAAAGGKIYVLGGDTVTGCCVITTANEEYDPVSDTWSTRAPMPVAKEIFTAETLNGKVYVVGGGPGASATIEVYTPPPADSWSTAASMNVGRRQAVAAVVGGKLYAIGGEGPGPALDSVEEYDPVQNTWSFRAPLPDARGAAAGAVLDGKIYVVGGRGPDCSPCDTLFRYDPGGNTWEDLTPTAPMPTARMGQSAVAYDCALYVMGGSTNSSNALATVERYGEAGAADSDGDLTCDDVDNCPAVSNFGQQNADNEVGNGRFGGLPDVDDSVPNAAGDGDGDACETDGDADNDGIPDGTDSDRGGDLTYDDDNDGNPASGCLGGTDSDAGEDGPSWDANCNGLVDGIDDIPSDCSEFSATADFDTDRVSQRYEYCKWVTLDTDTDTDGDGLTDCLEIIDVDGSGTKTFLQDLLPYAKAVQLPGASFGKDGDFDYDGSNTLTFLSDLLPVAKLIQLPVASGGCDLVPGAPNP